MKRKYDNALTLFNLSIQDTLYQNKWMSSTLSYMTTRDFVTIAFWIEHIMKLSNLKIVRFLDVGAGLCYGLFKLSFLFSMKTVSIEINDCTYISSV